MKQILILLLDIVYLITLRTFINSNIPLIQEGYFNRPPAVVNIFGRSRESVIQENLERPVTVVHLENVLNDFQTKMDVVV